MMRSFFFATPLTHQCNSDSHSILLFIVHSENSSGFGAFRYFSVTQDFDPSFRSACSFHPDVVFLGEFFSVSLLDEYRTDLDCIAIIIVVSYLAQYPEVLACYNRVVLQAVQSYVHR